MIGCWPICLIRYSTPRPPDSTRAAGMRSSPSALSGSSTAVCCRKSAFDQLVNPRRSLPRESIRIHGIQPEVLAGQPGIEKVLRQFHDFAEGTVLVAHNAAFDMRLLQLKEDPTGIRLVNPVLDTMLLSAALHPAQARHDIESIAERLGIAVIGRHTALGDAMATAEIFLKLIPLLAGMGMATLKQAREGSQKTYYARPSF